LQLEIVCKSRTDAQKLVSEFGGRGKKLPRDWLKRFARIYETRPLKIGKRLLIFNLGGTSAARLSRHKGRSHIFIPAGGAFGTGDHATTALSLRLLEQLTRQWNAGWSIVDLGTGSGILALSAKCFGAEHVVAIDLDPVAISTAKTNAQLNKIDNVVTANLFSQLLIEILPKLKRGRWLILSGVLRDQEKEFIYALRRSKIDIVQVRRRGKWIAVLAKTI